MIEKSQRRSRIVIGALAVAGVILLFAWMFSVTAYGFEADVRGLVAGVRAQDIALFVGGAAMLLAATVILIVQRRIA